MPCQNLLVLGRQNMEKRDNKIFMQSPGSLYLVMQGNLPHIATTTVKKRIKKRGCIGRKKESIFQSGVGSNWQRTVSSFMQLPTWTYSANHKFRVLQDYKLAGATGRHVTRCKASFFSFLFSAAWQSRKQVAHLKKRHPANPDLLRAGITLPVTIPGYHPGKSG